MKAFAHQPISDEQSKGMDLRDYFAAKALQAIVSKADVINGHFYLENAQHAYKMADAMMEAREMK